jgi:hypothetical protein
MIEWICGSTHSPEPTQPSLPTRSILISYLLPISNIKLVVHPQKKFIMFKNRERLLVVAGLEEQEKEKEEEPEQEGHLFVFTKTLLTSF